VWASRYAAGVGWGAAEMMETGGLGNADAPQVACDASGNALAVWCQSDGSSRSIWANRYVAGYGWGVAEPVDIDNPGDAFDPQIALDGSGNAVVVWECASSTQTKVWANRYVVGRGWGTAARVSTKALGNENFPQIAVDVGGKAIAVWKHSESTQFNIWASLYV
jgi:hypothetical protein